MKHTNKNINLIYFKKTLLKITVVDTFQEFYQQNQ
jgi:hypothetical protein